MTLLLAFDRGLSVTAADNLDGCDAVTARDATVPSAAVIVHLIATYVSYFACDTAPLLAVKVKRGFKVTLAERVWSFGRMKGPKFQKL
jgi:hypothetical protein